MPTGGPEIPLYKPESGSLERLVKCHLIPNVFISLCILFSFEVAYGLKGLTSQTTPLVIITKH